MTIFLRLLTNKDKASNLLASCAALRASEEDTRVFQVEPEFFQAVPGAPFAYWVSENVTSAFQKYHPMEAGQRVVRIGLTTHDDFRWLRLVWEINRYEPRFEKGGEFSPYYYNPHLCVLWEPKGNLLKSSKRARFLLGELTENNSRCWNESLVLFVPALHGRGARPAA